MKYAICWQAKIGILQSYNILFSPFYVAPVEILSALMKSPYLAYDYLIPLLHSHGSLEGAKIQVQGFLFWSEDIQMQNKSFLACFLNFVRELTYQWQR